MNNNIMFLIFLAALISLIANTLSLTLEGSWVLQQLQDHNPNLSVNFSYYVFRNQSIMGKMQIAGCDLLSYQFNLEEDNIYIDISSQRVDSVGDCSEEQSLELVDIQAALRQVLKFTIINDVMVFMNPSKDSLITFKRFKNVTYESWQVSLVGSWMTRMIGKQETSYVMIANESALSLCSGAIFNFKIAALYQIKLTLQSPGGCKDQNVINNVLSVTFYRKFDQKLEFYDNGINLLFESIQNPNGNKLMPQSTPTSSIVSPSSNNTQTSGSGFPPGKYFLLLLYNRGLGRIEVSVSSSLITIQLCSQLSFAYSLVDKSNLKIQSELTPVKNCSKGNEELIFNNLLQSVKYTIDADGVITLIDNNGKSIIALSQ